MKKVAIAFLAGWLGSMALAWLLIEYEVALRQWLGSHGTALAVGLGVIVVTVVALAVIYRKRWNAWLGSHLVTEEAYYGQMLGHFKMQLAAQGLLVLVFVGLYCAYGFRHLDVQLPLWRSATIVGLLLTAMLWVMWSFWQLYRQIREGQIFTLGNAQQIRRLSMGIALASCFLLLIGMPVILFNAVYNGFFVLLSIMSLGFDLIGYMTTKGLEMQKEQELTI